jgi:Uma2 family endonuclease
MATLLTLGPADQGRTLTVEEYESAQYEPGYQYELIDGRLVVFPTPNFPHDRVANWCYHHLLDYSRAHPDVINYVSPRPRVFLEERPQATRPEPDIAAFQGVPLDQPTSSINWQALSPVLVVEVISEDTADKDLERNVELYLEVPSIREYWIVDPRPDADRPTLLVHRRRGRRWQRRIDVPFGGTYTTRLLPGFSLVVNLRA